jgi:hypothetical protein
LSRATFAGNKYRAVVFNSNVSNAGRVADAVYCFAAAADD